MTTRMVFHVGTPKTGSTFLQSVIFQNRDRLRAHGVLVPGQSLRFHNFASAGVRQGPHGSRYQIWESLLAEIDGWPGTVLVTNEWFSMASDDRTAAALRQLTELGEVHIVATARDLVDQVPAAWQETLKLGESSQIDDFALGLDRPRGRWRWSVLDVAEVLDRWAAPIKSAHAHVVTVPPKGSPPGILWERYAAAAGIDPTWCFTDVDFARESLSVQAARLLQLAGPMLLDAIDAENSGWRAPYRWIQRHLSHGMLLNQPGDRITMGPEQIAAVRERSQRSIEQIRGRGYDVRGDLADLTSSQLPDGAVHPDTLEDSEVLPVALRLVADLLGEARRTAPNQKS